MDFLDEMQRRVIVGDGAMGTELMAAGVSIERCFEELCVSEAGRVRAVHESYIAAGARLIRTNSFGGNAVRLATFGCKNRVSEINWSAAQLAKDCAKGKGVLVAGSVGPLGIPAAEAGERGIDREAVFNEQIGALLDGGVNLVFLETFLDLEELLIAVNVKHSLHHCPVVASLVAEGETLRDGMSLAVALETLHAADVDVLGINCVEPSVALRVFEMIGGDRDLLHSAFPNAGNPRPETGRPAAPMTPTDFGRTAVELARRGARLIGGCCGTTPRHIAAVAEAVA